MALSLEVVKPDKWRGKVVAVSCSPFVIGRDPDCHLRTTSRTVSQRQCAIHVRDRRAFVQDLNTTNGTFVNGRQIKGEIEILDGDEVMVTPLVFRVRVAAEAEVSAHSRPTPPPENSAPPKSRAQAIEDEAAAALLESLSDEDAPTRDEAEEAHSAPASQTTLREIKTSLLKPGATPPPEPFGTTSSAREILKKLKKKPPEK